MEQALYRTTPKMRHTEHEICIKSTVLEEKIEITIDRKDVLIQFKDFQEVNKYCDINLHVEDGVFPCHRVLLAATVPYFDAMLNDKFIESKQKDVTLHAVDVTGIKVLLEYVYMGKIKIDEYTAKSGLRVGNFFGIDTLIDICTKFIIERINLDNALDYYLFADSIQAIKLKNYTFQFIQRRFSTIANSETFMKVPCFILEQFLSSDSTVVKNEEYLFEVVSKWINYNADERIQYGTTLLDKIRFKYIKLNYIVDEVLASNVVSNSCNIIQLVNENRKMNFNVRACEGSILAFVPKLADAANNGVIAMRYNTIECTEEVSELNFPIECDCVQTVKYEDNIFMFTYSFLANNNQFSYYDFVKKTWLPLKVPELPVRTYNMVILRAINSIYANGSLWATTSDSYSDYNIYCYAVDLDKWFPVSAIGYDIQNTCLMNYGNVIYCCGGYSKSKGFVAQTLMFDPRLGKWLTMRPMLDRLAYTGGTVLNNKLYVTGGCEISCNKNIVQTYDVVADKWEYINPMVKPNSGVNVISCHDKIWVVGGSNKVVEFYDLVSGIWTFKEVVDFNGRNIGVIVD